VDPALVRLSISEVVCTGSALAVERCAGEFEL
jgi:hypothetical protein